MNKDEKSMTMDSAEKTILMRIGILLVAIGVVDIGYMAYCIANKISYTSSFNIFAVWLGILLMRNNLWATSKVRFFATLFLTINIGFILAAILMQPASLTLAKLHHLSILTILSSGALICLLSWIVVQLNEEPVLDALRAAGRKVWSPQIPALVGICLVIALYVGIAVITNTQKGERARELATAKLGTGYQYYVHSMHVSTTNHHTFVAAMVSAWNNNDLQEIPVEWEEYSK